ncbi:LOW QUALITY PROTEIN: BTB/POZ domain-containing protein At2g13690 [Salvia miltiorrhiza]|uniref:LOW QUALITY PROTEIN: BTB/POZ domain-containing protein At2g13690 n=1 Tax=Salvia miltiorrhiza TaxID=226208 RepID=UPI0025AC1456|nr:LOW QUALITY PROTEIN: BTB/POZ domain-containing protein At2g13690 [Salvia miltiorrhiza]
MHDLKSQRRREPPLHRRRYWCCSFTTPPLSPENPGLSHSCSVRSHSSSCSKKTQLPFSNSPQTQKTPLARRILSPGRVSPISEHPVVTHTTPKNHPIPKSPLPLPVPPPPPLADSAINEGNLGIYDTRLNLKGKNGGSLVLELSSEVLASNSSVFADLIADYRKNVSGLCRVEVPDVENLNVFRETIELMFEEDIQKKLVKIGVFRAIDILEVSASIKFGRCVSACLQYLEAVPWTEEEEEKLRELFNGLKVDDPKTKDIRDRFCSLSPIDSQPALTKQLIWSITTCNDATAGSELKSLVKGLLCKSSVYEKDYPDLNKEDMYAACESCLKSLSSLLEETSGSNAGQKLTKKEKEKPLLERISKQVDNINWLVDILLDHQMAEEFVHLWANQEGLLKLHKDASPMVKYELSRVSAVLFTAIGTRRLHCPPETRLRLLQAWFRPMLSDFGWLQRSKKGLDMKALEEAMGQALLTLPLKEQYSLFMEWFRCFSKHGNECPNLSKAFQIWWRRSFLRGSETMAIESR